MKQTRYRAKFNVKARETQDEIKAGDTIYVERIIDQINPMVFLLYGSGSVRSFPISLAVFQLAFEEATP